MQFIKKTDQEGRVGNKKVISGVKSLQTGTFQRNPASSRMGNVMNLNQTVSKARATRTAPAKTKVQPVSLIGLRAQSVGIRVSEHTTGYMFKEAISTISETSKSTNDPPMITEGVKKPTRTIVKPKSGQICTKSDEKRKSPKVKESVKFSESLKAEVTDTKHDQMLDVCSGMESCITTECPIENTDMLASLPEKCNEITKSAAESGPNDYHQQINPQYNCDSIQLERESNFENSFDVNDYLICPRTTELSRNIGSCVDCLHTNKPLANRHSRSETSLNMSLGTDSSHSVDIPSGLTSSISDIVTSFGKGSKYAIGRNIPSLQALQTSLFCRSEPMTAVVETVIPNVHWTNMKVLPETTDRISTRTPPTTNRSSESHTRCENVANDTESSPKHYRSPRIPPSKLPVVMQHVNSEVAGADSIKEQMNDDSSDTEMTKKTELSLSGRLNGWNKSSQNYDAQSVHDCKEYDSSISRESTSLVPVIDEIRNILCQDDTDEREDSDISTDTYSSDDSCHEKSTGHTFQINCDWVAERISEGSDCVTLPESCPQLFSPPQPDCDLSSTFSSSTFESHASSTEVVTITVCEMNSSDTSALSDRIPTCNKDFPSLSPRYDTKDTPFSSSGQFFQVNKGIGHTIDRNFQSIISNQCPNSDEHSTEIHIDHDDSAIKNMDKTVPLSICTPEIPPGCEKSHSLVVRRSASSAPSAPVFIKDKASRAGRTVLTSPVKCKYNKSMKVCKQIPSLVPSCTKSCPGDQALHSSTGNQLITASKATNKSYAARAGALCGKQVDKQRKSVRVSSKELGHNHLATGQMITIDKSSVNLNSSKFPIKQMRMPTKSVDRDLGANAETSVDLAHARKQSAGFCIKSWISKSVRAQGGDPAGDGNRYKLVSITRGSSQTKPLSSEPRPPWH